MFEVLCVKSFVSAKISGVWIEILVFLLKIVPCVTWPSLLLHAASRQLLTEFKPVAWRFRGPRSKGHDTEIRNVYSYLDVWHKVADKGPIRSSGRLLTRMMTNHYNEEGEAVEKLSNNLVISWTFSIQYNNKQITYMRNLQVYMSTLWTVVIGGLGFLSFRKTCFSYLFPVSLVEHIQIGLFIVDRDRVIFYHHSRLSTCSRFDLTKDEILVDVVMKLAFNILVYFGPLLVE